LGSDLLQIHTPFDKLRTGFDTTSTPFWPTQDTGLAWQPLAYLRNLYQRY
jgi:hypothetical protein